MPVINRVFFIDDDEDDCHIFSEALRQVSPDVLLKCINNYSLAIEEMSRFQPELIFLDLNMPGKNGFECLQELKSHPVFKNIPVTVFSSSEYYKDIDKAYASGATLYFAKPGTFEKLASSLKIILNMNWKEPAEITSRHLVNGRYLPFDASVTG